MFKKVLFLVFSLVISGAILFSNQIVTYADFYQVKQDLKMYNGAQTSSNNQIIPAGDTIYLYCYVNGESYMGSTHWVYASHNSYDYGYIPDYFLIGSSSPLIRYCEY